MERTPEGKPIMGISKAHNVISSYFIGPKSENMDDFRKNISAILDQIVQTRSEYQPDDDVRSSPHENIM